MKGITTEVFKAATQSAVHGSYVTLFGERYYRIHNYDAMPPFFMTIVSSSDVWNYIWSNGALTAGRINSDKAIFPYYTADKVYDGQSFTGSYTAISVPSPEGTWLWEPFSESQKGLWSIERNLYKNDTGSKIYFEEINKDLNIAFMYGWTSSDAFGLVRESKITNLGPKPIQLSILDGCRNILPACITSVFQNDNSVLLDAYKKTDLLQDAGIAVFSVTSIISDKAEPSEALLANVSWFSVPGELCLSPAAPAFFRKGQSIPVVHTVKGERPAFFIKNDYELAPSNGTESWYQVFNTSLDSGAISDLAHVISNRTQALSLLEKDIQCGQDTLTRFIADADGFQDTAETSTVVHHTANVMFNIMRGGIFADNNKIDTADVLAFISTRNHKLSAQAKTVLNRLGAQTDFATMIAALTGTGDPQLARLAAEYLPLSFSRRHGDPSRPWNRFSIELKDSNGKRKLNYQGNWRDIFQNWEALAFSYPAFLPNMTAKFLNAMTVDGFNPYRITRDGIDWEVKEIDNPWSNIGYWGDHQVIYLAKLLELESRHNHNDLCARLDERLYSSANVPYRIKPYADIVRDPRSTIIFDETLHNAIMKKTESLGTDAKLVLDKDDNPQLVSMTTKFISIICAKMANLIPLGGIWLNTQRPEWNDANNALAGWGLSIVTLCYLRRFLSFLEGLYADAPNATFAVPAETADFFRDLSAAWAHAPENPNALERRAFVDSIGSLFEKQREALYAKGYANKTIDLTREEIIKAFTVFRTASEQTIRANKRQDGLYHAYNTLSIATSGGMDVQYLNEMLEGQVAVISSLLLSSKEVLDLCKAMKEGPLFRKDQYSYILYPNKELPHFCAKNIVNEEDALRIPSLARLLASGNTSIMFQDSQRACHFNPSFRNAQIMEAAFNTLSEAIPQADRQSILELYEKTFNHQSFTGRSGTFYAYEGLGSIYWHMVSKLMLAVQEYALAEQDETVAQSLTDLYYDIRSGIGFNKTPEIYGAFPTDPYSHTPAGQGAKQPGMTGQVKEEVITRWGELGVSVSNGIVSFAPRMLRTQEFHSQGTLSFSWCAVPVEYRLVPKTERPRISCILGGKEHSREGNALDSTESKALLGRTGEIERIIVTVPL